MDLSLEKINFYISSKNYVKAESLCKKYLEKNPHNTNILEILAKIYLQKNEHSDALKIYKDLNSKNKENTNFLVNIALCYNKLGKFDKSIKIYEGLAQNEVNNLYILYNYAKVLKDANKIKESSIILQKIINVDSKNQGALNLLGRISLLDNDYAKAISYFNKVLLINPVNFTALKNFSSLMVHSYGLIKKEDYPVTENLLCNILDNKEIGSEDITKIIEAILLEKIEERAFDQTNADIISKLDCELFHKSLRNNVITDIKLEEIIKIIRKDFLSKIINNNIDDYKIADKFITSLSIQSFLNEYIWHYDDEEIVLIKKIEKKIKSDDFFVSDFNKFYIYIFYCYKQIKDRDIKKELTKNNYHLNNNFIKYIFSDREYEQALKKQIPTIGNIEDKISKKIASQYENSPYPRWNSISLMETQELEDIINLCVHPNTLSIPKKDKLNVLIAGCGTGKVVVSAANLYKNSNIYAFDLSKSSLSYAKRLTEEYQQKNVSFFQSDILEASNINKTFDIIECTGVLHHMDKPLLGLKGLVNLLKNNGYIKLSLYSTKSRKFVKMIRKDIAMNKLKINKENMIEYRNKMIVDYKKYKFTSSDFYSLSGFRDLFFNVKEHTFSQVEVKKIIDECGLEFLGYYFRDPEIKNSYRKRYPQDTKCLNLENWDEFENYNNLAFAETPFFWCKKIEK